MAIVMDKGARSIDRLMARVQARSAYHASEPKKPGSAAVAAFQAAGLDRAAPAVTGASPAPGASA